jgi:hypothetical protein
MKTTHIGGLMKSFILGILIGSVLTGTAGGAGNLYDSKGNMQAPRGSTQQIDYFRQRQQWLDLHHTWAGFILFASMSL